MMIAMGALSMRSELKNCTDQTYNHIENCAPYQTICQTPAQTKRNKKKQKSQRCDNGSFLSIVTESSSDSNESANLPEPEQVQLCKKKPKNNVKCPKCAKGFNVRSNVVKCAKCCLVYHVKCIRSTYHEDNFNCDRCTVPVDPTLVPSMFNLLSIYLSICFIFFIPVIYHLYFYLLNMLDL